MKKSKKLFLKYNFYLRILIGYLNLYEFRNLSPLTISSKRLTITSLMNYLGDNGVKDFSHCKQKHVVEYLNSIANLASSTISGRKFQLRHFFNHLNKENVITYCGNDLFPVILTNKRERVLSFYSAQEVNQLIKSVDRTTKYGKRDYAIILLVTELGIRSSDIINLKIHNINWNRKTIEFYQVKTKRLVQLPLLDDIKYALIDYLKNSRPKSNLDNIFLGIKNKSRQLTNTGIHQIISKHFMKADIDISNRRHGPHSMRHSLASNLLQNNTPMHIIKSVLGHSNINTTMIYLNIDVTALKQVALEVPYEKD